MKHFFTFLLVFLFYGNLHAQCWEEISTNGQFAIARKTNGTLWTWGRNDYGQLADGTNTDKLLPVQVGTSVNWKFGSAGGLHGAALKTDASLWTWGYNSSGQLGNGTTVSSNVPIQVPGSWKDVAAGTEFTAAITTDGRLFLWGLNTSNQVSPSNTNMIITPTQYGSSSDWNRVYVGEASVFALKNNGTLWTWGNNAYGTLGQGTAGPPVATPMQIDAGVGNTWTKVAGGGLHAIALKSDKTIWGAGQNFVGNLGTGNTTDSHVFIQIGTNNNWIDIDAGTQHSIAINENYEFWSWGDNLMGQLGDGTTNDSYSPILITGMDNSAKISAGSRVSSIIEFDGTMHMCGQNNFGTLADGTTTDRNTFFELPTSLCSLSTALDNNNILNSSNIVAYPSPAYDIFNIDIKIKDFDNLTTINFFNVDGKLVLSSTQQKNIDISTLSKGIYTYKIISENSSYNGKMIKFGR